MKHQEKERQEAVSIARSARSVSIAVFLSRILGLVREQVLAALFGASAAMDAYVVAFRIPNLLRDLFAEGALSSAFVTVFSRYRANESRKETAALVNSVFSAITIVVSVICILGMTYSQELVSLIAPDFAQVPGKLEMARDMTRIMMPFLLTISIAALFMGILNTCGYFFIPSFASACFNLGSILLGTGLALLFPKYGWPGIYGMAIGTLFGGFLQMAVQIPLVIRAGFSIRPTLRLAHPGLRTVARLMIPAVVGLSATQINIFINTNFASQCAEGSVSWLNYSFRIMFFPIGLFGVALSVATHSSLAKLAAQGEYRRMSNALVSSLTMMFCMTIPATCGLWLLAKPIIALIFQHGRFTSFDTVMTAQALQLYAIGLTAYSAVKILVPVFYNLNNTRWPVAASFSAVAVNIVIIIIFLDQFQHRAIALSTSLSILFNFLLLATVLYRKLGGFPVRRLMLNLTGIVAAAAIMSIAVKGIVGFVPKINGTAGSALQVFAGIACGITAYALPLWFLGSREIRELMNSVISRMK